MGGREGDAPGFCGTARAISKRELCSQLRRRCSSRRSCCCLRLVLLAAELNLELELPDLEAALVTRHLQAQTRIALLLDAQLGALERELGVVVALARLALL